MFNQHTALTEESINDYLAFMAVTGLLPRSCKAYGSNLRSLLVWHGQPALSHDDLETEAMRWLTTSIGSASSSTIHQRRSSIMSYARWARVGGRDFMAYYRAPKKKRAEAHPIPEGMEGIERLLQACDTQDEMTLIALCGLMGLRINEAVTTRTCDVDIISDPKRPILHVIDGKGNKPRDLPIYPRPLGYIVCRAFADGFSGGPLVQVEYNQARRRVTQLGVQAGLSRPISTHDLRATFATDMYQRTKDILAVKGWLGHASVETTVGYCGMAMSQMLAAVA
jgi:integrase